EDDDNPPIITSQPQNLIVRAGFNAIFRVTAAGSTPFSYQWRRNGANLVGATNRNLIVSNVQPADDGSIFSVRVSNKITSILSTEAVLTFRPTSAPLTNPGAVDLSFASGLGADDPINTLAVQSDGRVLIGGAFTMVDGTPRRRVARLLANGSLDG